MTGAGSCWCDRGSIHLLPAPLRSDLSSNKISAVSRLFGPTSTISSQLLLTTNPLQLVPDNMLEGCTVQSIAINHNQLPEFPPLAFKNQPFSNLAITNNKIVKVPKSGLDGLKATLTTLDLSSNEIEELEDGTFAPLSSLTKV